MSKQKFLREYYQLCPDGVCQDFLTEDDKRRIVEDGTVYLTGLIQCADKKNGNGRIYPRNILEREVRNYQKIIKERRALGELDHPESPIVNLKNVSHIVENVWWEGNEVWGKIRVLKNHPSGQILEGLIKDGVAIGVSSRGLGSVSEADDCIIVEDDYQMICYDIVQEPSTHNAFLIKENKTKFKFSKADRIYRSLNNILK